ncbi:MAG: hypothetical protein FWC47_00330 [Oscillospiraceae bacterium]|nr:hypothetical protein [Oscillospiraceae bacterium]
MERKEYDTEINQFNDTSEFPAFKQDDEIKENYSELNNDHHDNNYLSDKIISILFLILKVILRIIMLPLLVLTFLLDRSLKILSKIIGTGLILASIVAVLVLTYRHNFIDQAFNEDFLSKVIVSVLVFAFAIVILIIPPKVHLAYLKEKNFIFSVNKK